jgi:cation transport ATPase
MSSSVLGFSCCRLQVYFALLCAGTTYLVTFDIVSTISVIIVAGACGVAAGTPLAILGAIGQAARLVLPSHLYLCGFCFAFALTSE